MAAKFFTGIPLDGPDPECVQGYGEAALEAERLKPAAGKDHSKKSATRNRPVMLTLQRREDLTSPPVSACAQSPLAGFAPSP